jgi:hypothetical protein
MLIAISVVSPSLYSLVMRFRFVLFIALLLGSFISVPLDLSFSDLDIPGCLAVTSYAGYPHIGLCLGQAVLG